MCDKFCKDCKHKHGRYCHHEKSLWEYTNPVTGRHSKTWDSCELMRGSASYAKCKQQGYLWEPKVSFMRRIINWFKELR